MSMLEKFVPGQNLADGFVYLGKRIVGNRLSGDTREPVYEVFAQDTHTGARVTITGPESLFVG
jgi:hypothetical protein